VIVYVSGSIDLNLAQPQACRARDRECQDTIGDWYEAWAAIQERSTHSIVYSQGYCLATKPVANIVCIAIDERDAHGCVENHLEVFEKVGINEITGLLEGEVDVVVRLCGVVRVDTKSFLRGRQVKIVDKVGRWSRINVRMTNVIHTAAAEEVVWALDVVSAHILSFCTDCLTSKCGLVHLEAQTYLVQTAIGHVQCKLHVVVYRVIDCLDSVCVVDGKLWVIRSLNVLIDDTIDYCEGVELHSLASLISCLDSGILLVEIVEESWTIVTAIGLGCEIEGGGLHFRVELWQGGVETLEHFPCCDCGKISSV